MPRNQQALDFLAIRKSVPLGQFKGPGPDDAELRHLLTIAARAPDHGRKEPWRFIIYRGDAVLRAGEAFAKRAEELRGPLSDADRERELNRLNRAPLAVGVVSNITDTSSIPEWEQFLSAGAVAMNLVSAATAAGWATNWVTGWYSDDPDMRAVMGLEPHERMAGIVHIGSCDVAIPDRPRPDIDSLVCEYQGPKG